MISGEKDMMKRVDPSLSLGERCPHFEVSVVVVDVAVRYIRENHRGEPLPEVDWRLHVRLPSGAECTFGYDATAADVAGYLEREGLRPVGDKL